MKRELISNHINKKEDGVMNRVRESLTGMSTVNMCVVVLLLMFSFSTKMAHAEESINYRLKWLFNASVAGDLWADEHGLFKAAGLNVSVKEGGPERDAIKELELGQAQFGVASADQVIRARSKGAPVVVIAQLFQVNPLHWIYRAKEIQLKDLEDFKGKTVGITYGGNDETIMRTLMAKGKLTEKDLKLFSVRYDFTPFYKKEVEIWPCYINSQGPLLSKKLREAGEDVAFFNPADFGVKFVANSIVTSEEMINKHPDVVKKFAAALIKGWQEALKPANAETTQKTLVKFDKDTPPEIMKAQLDLTRDLIQPNQEVEIGTIDIDAWKQTEEIMLTQKVIPKPINVEKVLKPQL